MIFTDRKITIRNGKSSINEPVILYRGDFEVSIRFTIMESKFRFKSGVNLVDSEKASFGQLAILAPYGGNVFSEIVKCEDGTVTFTLTKEMIDQLEEVGLYSFQIRLFDYYRESRVSIPPVEFGIEVREPVASEDHDNEVNNAIVGYSIAKVVDGLNEDVGDTFDANGNYNKTNWETGDRISQGKLNKIEDALDKINRNEKNDVAVLNGKVDSNYRVLNVTKADDIKVDSIQNQIDKLVLGAVGDGNNAEVIQARGAYDILNDRITAIEDVSKTALTAGNNADLFVSGEITNVEFKNYMWAGNNVGWQSAIDRATTVTGYDLQAGDIITCDDFVNYSIHVVVFNRNTNNWLYSTGWLKEPHTVSYEYEGIYYVTMKNDSGAETLNELTKMRKLIRIIKKNTLLNKIEEEKSLDAITDAKLDELEETLYKTISNMDIRFGTLNSNRSDLAITTHAYDLQVAYHCGINSDVYEYCLHSPSGKSTSTWKKKSDGTLFIINSSYNKYDMYVMFRRSDEKELTIDDLKAISKSFVIKKKELGNIDNIYHSIDVVNNKIAYTNGYLFNEFDINMDLEFERKMYVIDSWTSQNSRCAQITPITTLKTGDTIKILDPSYLFCMYNLNEDETAALQTANGWADIHTMTADSCRTYLIVRRVDNGILHEDDFQKISKSFMFYRNYAIAPGGLADTVESIKNDIYNMKYNIVSYDTIIEERNLTITAGDYHISSVTPKRGTTKMFGYVKTDDMTGKYVNYICLRQRVTGSISYNDNRTNATYKGDGVYTIEFNYNNETEYSDAQLFIDLRNYSDGAIHVEIALVNVEGAGGNSSEGVNSELILYVSPDGDDSNNGRISSPKATVNAALRDGASEVRILGGVYRQTIDFGRSPRSVIRICRHESNKEVTFVPSNNILCSSETLVAGTTKVYRSNINVVLESNNKWIYQDGIPDETTLISQEERHPLQRGYEYRCGDTVIKLCNATNVDDAIAEIESSSEYKWFAYNNVLYFSRPSNVNTENPICFARGVLFSGTANKELRITGINVKYMAFNISATNNSEIADCKAVNVFGGGAFAYDRSVNCKFIRCEAARCCNGSTGDGFNSHCNNTGDIYSKQMTVTLIDCWSHDNNDDGYSDHERAEHTMIGGLFEYNTKGGVTPSYGAHITCYNVLSRCNYNGFNLVGDAAAEEGGKFSQMVCYNCVAENNTRGGTMAGFAVSGAYNTMMLVDCKSINNGVGYRLGDSTNSAKLIDCGTKGDGQVRVGDNFTIINTSKVE